MSAEGYYDPEQDERARELVDEKDSEKAANLEARLVYQTDNRPAEDDPGTAET